MELLLRKGFWHSGCKHICIFVLLILAGGLQAKNSSGKHPNVLMIMIDDLNDCLEGMGGHKQSISPNISELAASGVFFKQAYTNAPMCGPSRASLFTGIYPHHSRNFFQAPWFKNEVLNNTRTLMEQFKLAGYQVYGTGKIMHHNQANLWTHFEHAADYGPSVFNGSERIPHPDVPSPFSDIGWVDGSLGPFIYLAGRKDKQGNPLSWTTGNGGNIPYKTMHYKNDEDRDPSPDEVNAAWTEKMIAQLSKKDSEDPFFLSVGFLRLHTPLVAPQTYF
ncbi:MAG: sulfatase-like hydrolase/transferase, partial [Bacteroidota bacterium]